MGNVESASKGHFWGFIWLWGKIGVIGMGFEDAGSVNQSRNPQEAQGAKINSTCMGQIIDYKDK
jgi:hypothetical protein